MTLFAFITWNVNPEIISFGTFAIRWYGLLFALGFVTGQLIFARIFKLENKPEKDLEALLIYMVVSTVIGARLGHVLFYQPDYYLTSEHFIEIFKIWEGGLASHGAGISILIAIYLYSRNRPGQSFLWVADRMVIVIALGGAFIRLGNLMNSEMIGIPTDLPWAFIFTAQDNIPRHPAQLYEAIYCFMLFFFLWYTYNRMREKTPEGLLLGLFLVILFTLRFVDEYFKENQVAFEDTLSLNMGQILSIPLVLLGFYFLYVAKNNADKKKMLPTKQ